MGRICNNSCVTVNDKYFLNAMRLERKYIKLVLNGQWKEFGYLTYSMNENELLFKKGSDVKLNPPQLWKLSAI